MIPPLESFTVPVICAFCAEAAMLQARQQTKAANPTSRLRMCASTRSLAASRRLPLRRRAGGHDGTNPNGCKRYGISRGVFLDAVDGVLSIAQVLHARHQIRQSRF